MHRVLFKVAAALAALSVLFGAFGAHLLKKHLLAEDLNGYHTAVTYQMTHAIALFIAGLLYKHYRNPKLIWAGYFFIAGILFFSGSIYLRLLFNFLQLGFGNTVIMLAPLGGILLFVGWVLIFLIIPDKKYVYPNKHRRDIES